MDILTGVIEHTALETNGIILHTVQAGPRTGRKVILLHGFPEFWYGWRRQIPFLAAQGYHVIAPDMRGYNLSNKPAGVGNYRLDALASDVVGLIDRHAGGRAALVGHDWGGIIAFYVAQNYPERLTRIVAINAPHIRAFDEYLRIHMTQVFKSAYAIFFQLPVLPELILRLTGAHIQALVRSSRPGAFTPADLEEYHEAMRQPWALTRMLNYYRAAGRFRPKPRIRDPRIHIPALILWGRRDAALAEDLARRSLQYCVQGRLEVFDDATHWVHHEEPERVNALIGGFLAEPTAPVGARGRDA